MLIQRSGLNTTHFLNVDLDILSKTDLQPLVATLGENVFVLFAGRVKRTYHAHLELVKITKTADETVREFCSLLNSLPRSARRLWISAKTRDFSIGVQAGNHPSCADFVLSAETVTAVSALGARIVLSVYAPDERVRKRTPTPKPSHGGVAKASAGQ